MLRLQHLVIFCITWLLFFGFGGIFVYAVYEQVWLEPIRVKPLRDRDDIRKRDLYSIASALEQYIRDHGPIYPVDYGERNDNDWDYSSQRDFMQFLVPEYIKKMPIDPINNGEGDVIGARGNGFSYGYYYDAEETPEHPKAEYYLSTRLEETEDIYQLSNTIEEIMEGQ